MKHGPVLPTRGPAAALRLVPVVPYERTAILALFADAIRHDPAYQPSVTCGHASVEQWFDQKQTDWARVATFRGRIVGYVAARKKEVAPGCSTLPPGREWELCRLVVAPDTRRLGVGSFLVGACERVFGLTTWASTHEGSDAHRLFVSRGWTPVGPAAWADDPTPGVTLVYERASADQPGRGAS